MNIISLNIDTALSKYKGNLATFPFSIVMQTRSQKVEKYCIATWPKLMTHEIYTMEDNLAKFKLYAYIKNHLTASDKKDIHKIFYDRHWMTPLDFNDKGSELQLTEFGCKTWSNPAIPYLELKGTITVDLLKVLNLYIKKKWITFETNKGILSETPFIKMNKDLPFIVRYSSSQTPYDIILKEITKQAGQSNSMITKMFVAKTKLKNIYSYDKKIEWENDKKTITVEIKEKIRLLKDKALADPIKYGLLGLATHKASKNLSTSSKVLAATYLYTKGKK